MPKKPTPKEKIHLITMGCSKNTVDSEVVLRQLQVNNWELTDNAEEASIGIINTCGFIEAAKDESIQTILQAVELKKQGKLKKVVVMGCLSERYAKELRDEIPEVDHYIGANKMDEVVKALGGEYKNELLGERMLTTPRHFAYLKISEGCDNPCSFCAIPIMRGGHMSKPMERILLEAERLASLDVKELVIIAQDSTYYGLDLYGKRRLPELMERLCEVDGIEWIRLMYAYPAKFPLELLHVYKRNPKICRYIDMPVQHVSDVVLKSMRRGISSRAQKELIDTIRAEIPDIALRTTIITGYPNEGRDEFEELLAFVKETKFDRLGVFTYSQEDDTTAFPLGDPLPQEVKDERRNRIMEAQREISIEKNQALVGKRIKVLIDEKHGDTAVARTEYDAPEVDNEVTVDSASGLISGQFYDVEIVDSAEYDLFAVPVIPVSQLIDQ
jgi:ribosomal protein S12 methylthiotransferase